MNELSEDRELCSHFSSPPSLSVSGLWEGAIIIIEETKERRYTEALRIPFLFCGMYMKTKKEREPANKTTFCHDSIIAIPGNMHMCC